MPSPSFDKISMFRELRDEGLTQETALNILEQLREENKIDEDLEDHILEIMDFVSGYWQKRFKIWDKDLSF